MPEETERTPEDEVMAALLAARQALEKNKPGDRSGKDRSYAVTSTLVEQAIAYFAFWAQGKHE